MKTIHKAMPALLAVTVAFAPFAPQAQAKGRKHPNLEHTADAIKRILRHDGYLKRFKLDTDTVGNHIELDGKVNTYKQRGRAFTLARRFAPRYQIKNNIAVDYSR